MKKFILFICAALVAAGCGQKINSSVPAAVRDGVVVLETPEREDGQQSALGLTIEPLDTVHIAFVGIGQRGKSALKRYIHMDHAVISAVCDIEADRVKAGNEIVTSAGLPAANEYVGAEAYKEICERSDIDLVYIVTDWKAHTPIAVYAMEHGKNVAIEVPAALSIAECWQLVNTCEKTRKHCMMLENCVYDFFESATLNMAQQGLFGEIYHVEGAYIHNLDQYWDTFYDNWRLAYNQNHRGDNYPTHGFGPVCQLLNIHRGDKLNFVVSMDTESYHGREMAEKLMGTSEFADGEHTISLIRTEKGKLIEIQHNVYASRPYSRMYQLTGTKGFANKYPLPGGLALASENIPDASAEYDNLEAEKFVPQELFEKLMQDYKPGIVKSIEEKARKVGGHGGMDYIMDYRMIYCMRHGLPLDMDVYDAAEWCCLSELSRISIENHSMPVAVPDFTRGDWNKVQGYRYAED